jgi:rhodanese-related sulfurtransferase
MFLFRRCFPLVVLALASCGSELDSVRRVSVTELQQALDAGQAVVVDVRSTTESKWGHIKGAASIPLSQIRATAHQLPKDKLIVTYCA